MSKFSFIFSIVTATYNCAEYINSLLNSLISQTIGFKDNIELIIVDDGSTDSTFTVIEKWKQKYPFNINYIFKQNNGPASARNIGLSHAKGEWVTFIDADDFVSHNYFETITSFINSNSYDGSILVANSLLFIESQNQVFDAHPLSYKFVETNIADLLKQPTYIQLFTNTCFFKRELIEKFKLRFDERIKPTFEDAHFLNLALLRANDFRLAFIKEAHYFYRKRSRGNGLVEGGWSNPAKYHDQILFGYLNLVQQYQRTLGHTPEFIQNLILYEFHWYLSRILDGQINCSLTKEQHSTFFELATLLFRHIDSRLVLISSLPVLELRTRIAMLKGFKSATFLNLPLIITEISSDTTEIRLQHWATEETHYCFYNQSEEIHPTNEKRITHYFGNIILCYEYLCWAPLSEANPCWPVVHGEQTGVLCRNHILDTLKPTDVCRYFYYPTSILSDVHKSYVAYSTTQVAKDYTGAWLLMDRIDKADDNAEHFYRWLMTNNPQISIFFILDRKSADWHRLEHDGFKLLEHGSKDHFAALINADWLISSHINWEFTDPLGFRNLFGISNHKVAFLQHGITLHDISTWINQFTLECMISSTPLEYESLIGGRYKFTKREVTLTGFPRHDSLLFKAQSRKPGRVILICPTWREHLLRPQTRNSDLTGDEAEIFKKSDYFRNWNDITGSPSLSAIARDHGFKILFLIHPLFVRFLPLFDRSEAVSFINWTNLKSVQDLLVSCSMALTDYSSLLFEMAYINRPVAYFHFTEQPSFFSGNRTQGYFRYKKHGLGPVLNSKHAVEEWIHETICHQCIVREPYIGRVDAFFTQRDGQNCQRVYEAIIARSASIKQS